MVGVHLSGLSNPGYRDQVKSLTEMIKNKSKVPAQIQWQNFQILRKPKFQHRKDIPRTGERWDWDYLFWKRIDRVIADT